MFIQKPILITGAHRSGSTWIGKVVASSPLTSYVHEPFNIGIIRKNNPIEHWHQAVNDFTPEQKQEEILKYLKYFYALPKAYRKEQWSKVPEKYSFRDVLWLFKQRLIKRTVIKDPVAIFAAEWIYKQIACDVIVSIRHPAAFVASLKIKNWNTDFNELKSQKEFNHPILKKYEAQIACAADKQPDIISTGILLWNMIYDMVGHYKNTYGDVWQFYRHEDLSHDPLLIYQDLFKRIDLPFSEEVKDYILKTTQGDGKVDFERDAKRNITTWKNRLEQDEIDRVKEQTADIWKYFYNEKDW